MGLWIPQRFVMKQGSDVGNLMYGDAVQWCLLLGLCSRKPKGEMLLQVCNVPEEKAIFCHHPNPY